MSYNFMTLKKKRIIEIMYEALKVQQGYGNISIEEILWKVMKNSDIKKVYNNGMESCRDCKAMRENMVSSWCSKHSQILKLEELHEQ